MRQETCISSVSVQALFLPRTPIYSKAIYKDVKMIIQLHLQGSFAVKSVRKAANLQQEKSVVF